MTRVRDARVENRERGATLILFALMVVGVFTMVAIVLDWGQSRTDRRVNKSTADFASTAGVLLLEDSPRAAVCETRNYVLQNARFPSFESEMWVDGSGSAIANPCVSPPKVPCSPTNQSTWVRFTGLALGGNVKVEIRSPYKLPDPAYPEDAVAVADSGDPLLLGCEHVSVIITQTREEGFGGVIGAGDRTTSIRSVARYRVINESEQVAALILLERHDCNVLQTGGSNTRVVAKAFSGKPGILQLDSAGDSLSCPQPIINGQATSGGPSIVACSAPSAAGYANTTCAPNSAVVPPVPSIIAVFGKAIGTADSRIAHPFIDGKYGDTEVVGGKRMTRKPVDERYRTNVAALDTEVRQAICSDAGSTCNTLRTMPRGCTSVVNGTCTDNAGLIWRVVSDCSGNGLNAAFSGGVITHSNVFFACDLNIASALASVHSSSRIVVTGTLTVSAPLVIDDTRLFYIGGTTAGNAVGLDIKNGGTLGLNGGGFSNCPSQVLGSGRVNVLAVGKGSFKAGSGGSARLCQTFVYMANGYGKVPTTDGTAPCPSADNATLCSGYLGIIDIGSGASLDWSAPNEILTKPDDNDFLTKKFEDLAFWTEAATSGNSVNGGSSPRMTGIFFLPNADAFRLFGGSSLPIDLNAQFIARKLHVGGGGTINLTPDPDNAINFDIPILSLVR